MIIFFCLSLSSIAQNLQTELTLHADNELTLSVLKNIERKYNIHFSYSANLIPSDHRISVNAKDQKLSDFLDLIAETLPINYREINGQIVLMKAHRPLQTEPARAETRTAYSSKNIEHEKNKPEKTRIKTIYDTVVEISFDTITTVNFDTIVVVDTVRYFDTLRVVERVAPRFPFYINSYYKLPLQSSLTVGGEDVHFRTVLQAFGISFGRQFNWGKIDLGAEYNYFQLKHNESVNAVVETREELSISNTLEPRIRERTYYSLPANSADTLWFTAKDTIWETVADSSYTSVTDTIETAKNARVQQNIQLLSFPVRYSYPFKLSSKLQVAPVLGADFYIFIGSEKLVNGDNIEKQYTYSTAGVNVSTGIFCEYYLLESLSVYLFPRFSRAITPLFNSQNQDFMLHQADMQIGVSYKF